MVQKHLDLTIPEKIDLQTAAQFWLDLRSFLLAARDRTIPLRVVDEIIDKVDFLSFFNQAYAYIVEESNAIASEEKLSGVTQETSSRRKYIINLELVMGDIIVLLEGYKGYSGVDHFLYMQQPH